MKRISVFGSSTALPVSEEYKMAMEFGETIARKGWSALCGGYYGIMEALALGCCGTGGACTGIAVRELDSFKTPNKAQTQLIYEEELFQRTRQLIRMADAIVILDGNVGTMFELLGTWVLLQCHLLTRDLPVIVVGARMRQFVEYTSSQVTALAAQPEWERFYFCDSVSEIVRILESRFTCTTSPIDSATAR